MKRCRMKISTLFSAFAAGALAMVAYSGAVSDPVSVYVNPSSCYQWQTATNATMRLPVPYPNGAHSASLSINGTVVASGITGAFTVVTLPAPRGGASEDVYDLALVFDNGETATAKLALIDGYSGTATGSTRVLAPAGTREWGKVKGVAVVPVPKGTTSFSVAVDGGEASAVDTGLNGAAGWYAIRLKGVSTAVLEAETPEGDLDADIYGSSTGFILIIK